jgi:hypothetical protein
MTGMDLMWSFRRGRLRHAWGLTHTGEGYRLVRAREGPSGIVVSPATPDETAGPRPALRAARKRAGGRAVVYPIQDLSLQHERLNLPPMTQAMTANAVEQHCLAGHAQESAVEISYVADRPDEDPGDILVLSVDREVSEATAATLKADGYRPRRLMSAASVLTALVRATGASMLGEGAVALIHLGDELGSVAFVSDGTLVLGREFPLQGPPAEGKLEVLGPESTDPEAARITDILEEIDRSLLLFNHRFRGEPIERILLSSDRDRIEPLRRSCIERFGITTDSLIDQLDLDTTAFGEGELARRRVELWTLPIAAAVAGLRDDPDINLLPATHLTDQAWQRAGAIATAAVLAVTVGMAAFYTSKVALTARLSRTVDYYADRQAEMDEEVNELAHLGIERIAAANRLTFISQKRMTLAVMRHVLDHLANAAPDSLFIDRIDFGSATENDARTIVRIRGRVIAERSADVECQFSSFYADLKANRLFAEASVHPLTIGSLPGSEKSILSFDIVTPIGEEDSRGRSWP